MLISLHVKNLAIIDEEEIEFGSGLNILSGETGAGKSIILGALGLAMGGKPPKGLIRNEEEDAFCEAVFSVNKSQKAALNKMDIDTPEDEVILQRRITPQRSVAKINGESVPAGKLQEVADYFIDIYGQHDQQTLLSPKNHIKLLDEFAGEELSKVLSELSGIYQEYKSLKKEYEALNTDATERAREADLLSHEIHEIEMAKLIPGEEEELREEYRSLSQSDKIKSKVSEAINSIEGESVESIGRAIRLLREIEEYNEGYRANGDSLVDAESILTDVIHSLKLELDDLDLSEERINEVGNRLELIESLLRKYSKNGSIYEVLKTLEENREKLSKIEDFENYEKNLRENLKSLEGKLLSACERARTLRKKAGFALSAKVSKALLDLNFGGEGLRVNFEEQDEPTANGKDKVTFFISTNPGEDFRPLNEIASGGELSRIMLAIKTVFAGMGEIDTLVFDEIDTGVSGKTASRVAARLSSLSGDSQVICITHLPQIAAKANIHFLIEKSVRDGKTISSIRPLGSEERINEVARMLAGDDITEAALLNAKELLSNR